MAFNSMSEVMEMAKSLEGFDPELRNQMVKQAMAEVSAANPAQPSAPAAPIEQPAAPQPRAPISISEGANTAALFGTLGSQPQINDSILSSGIHSGKTRDMVAAWREAGKVVNDGKEVNHKFNL